MAQKDYVRRITRIKKVKGNKQKRFFSSMVIFIVSVVCILLIVIAGIHFVMKHRDAKALKKAQREATHMQAMEKQSQLPEKPEEKWRYIKALENGDTMSDVKQQDSGFQNADARRAENLLEGGDQQTNPIHSTLPTEKNNTSSLGQWTVQCGSFKTLDGAQSLKAKLALSGFDSSIKTQDNWNRVILGPFDSKQIAEEKVNALKNIDISFCIVQLAKG